MPKQLRESMVRLKREAAERGLLDKDGTFELLDLLVALFDDIDAVKRRHDPHQRIR